MTAIGLVKFDGGESRNSIFIEEKVPISLDDQVNTIIIVKLSASEKPCNMLFSCRFAVLIYSNCLPHKQISISGDYYQNNFINF